MTYLREQGYDLDQTPVGGASAGALTATLTAANVDFYLATNLAASLAKDAGVWTRRGGLQGIWGPLIRTWLDELLPDDVIETVNGRVRWHFLACPRTVQKNSHIAISYQYL